MNTTEIFKKMVAWLCDNIEGIEHQTDVARKAKLSPVNVSRIMNGLVKKVKPETLRKVNNAFGNVFNPEWMRGESDVMLAADMARQKPYSPTMQAPDPTIAELISAKDDIIAGLKREHSGKDEIIASLKRELTGKNETIASKDEVIVTKDALIANLQRQLDGLRLQSAMEKGASENGRSLSANVDTEITPPVPASR